MYSMSLNELLEQSPSSETDSHPATEIPVILYRMSHELRSLLRDLIPDLILSQRLRIHLGRIRNGSEVMSF